MNAIVNLLSFLCAIMMCGAPQFGVVTEAQEGIVAVKDMNGDVWEFYGDGWQTDDSILIVISGDKRVEGAY